MNKLYCKPKRVNRYMKLLVTSVLALAIYQSFSIVETASGDSTKASEDTRVAQNKRTASGLMYEIIEGGNEPIVTCTCWIESTVFVNKFDTHWLRRLAQDQTMIITNRRGFAGSSGRADQESEVLGLKEVIDAVGAPAILLGGCEAAVVPLVLAARYPERVKALIIVNGTARWAADDGYSGRDSEYIKAQDWTEDWEKRISFPPFPGIEVEELFGLLPQYVTGEALAGLWDGIIQADVRPELANISAPTIVIHSTKDEIIPFSQAQYLADHIKGAKLHRLQGARHHIDPSYYDEIAQIVREFLRGIADETTRAQPK